MSMSKLTIIYFSGTGNTEYVAKRFLPRLAYDNVDIVSIEDDVDFKSVARDSDDIMLLYPIIGGNMPIIMRDFLMRNREIFWNKGLITIVTEAGFSGDGGSLAYRFLDDSRVIYKASAHIIAPTNVSFGKLIRIKNGDELKCRLAKMNTRIDKIASDINNNHCRKQGSSKLSYFLGYHLQRKYFDRIESDLRQKFAVDSEKCIRCKKCISLCPVDNIVLDNGKIVGLGKCTLCYRCLHSCPVNAISIIRHEDVQYRRIDGIRES